MILTMVRIARGYYLLTFDEHADRVQSREAQRSIFDNQKSTDKEVREANATVNLITVTKFFATYHCERNCSNHKHLRCRRIHSINISLVLQEAAITSWLILLFMA